MPKKLIAVTIVRALFDGTRRDIPPGGEIPEGLDAETIDELMRLGAVREEWVEDHPGFDPLTNDAVDALRAKMAGGPSDQAPDDAPNQADKPTEPALDTAQDTKPAKPAKPRA